MCLDGVSISLNIMQKKYKDEAEKLKGSYVFNTPEIERVKNNQRNISSYMLALTKSSTTTICNLTYFCALQVKYQRGLKEMKGRYCGELDTPGLSSVRESQNDI
uniref:Uncharacterized protein n=1 Tax=Oncorhynchus mykiss TaxID=8022 RepID=A0A8C7W3V5_ONCMY